MNMTAVNASRRKALQVELERITKILRRSYDPEKIIVFGSFVQNQTQQWSDLDMAIIKQTKKRFIDRLLEVGRLAGNRLAVDFLVYTPQEFADMAQNNYFVRDEILQKGKVIYDKTTSS